MKGVGPLLCYFFSSSNERNNMRLVSSLVWSLTIPLLSICLSVLKGTLLPAGAMACVWIYGLHRHPGLWENPDTFLPRRWLDRAKQARDTYAP